METYFIQWVTPDAISFEGAVDHVCTAARMRCCHYFVGTYSRIGLIKSWRYCLLPSGLREFLEYRYGKPPNFCKKRSSRRFQFSVVGNVFDKKSTNFLKTESLPGFISTSYGFVNLVSSAPLRHSKLFSISDLVSSTTWPSTIPNDIEEITIFNSRYISYEVKVEKTFTIKTKQHLNLYEPLLGLQLTEDNLLAQ